MAFHKLRYIFIIIINLLNFFHLVYRTPEHRPMDAEVAELLTKSLHIEDSDRNLESDFAIIGNIENIVLAPREPVKRGEPLNYERWTMSLDSEGRVKNPEEVKHIIFKGVSSFFSIILKV